MATRFWVASSNSTFADAPSCSSPPLSSSEVESEPVDVPPLCMMFYRRATWSTNWFKSILCRTVQHVTMSGTNATCMLVLPCSSQKVPSRSPNACSTTSYPRVNPWLKTHSATARFSICRCGTINHDSNGNPAFPIKYGENPRKEWSQLCLWPHANKVDLLSILESFLEPRMPT